MENKPNQYPPAAIVHESGQIMTQTFEEALHNLALQARLTIGAHQSSISYSPNRDFQSGIHTHSFSEKYQDYNTYDVLPTGQGIWKKVMEEGIAMRMTQEELLAKPRLKNVTQLKDARGLEHPPLASWLAMPIFDKQGKTIGIIQLSDKFSEQFTEEDQNILSRFANITSLTFELYSLNQQLEVAKQQIEEKLMIASRDSITALPNRSSFMAHLNDSVSRTQRSNFSMALLYIDVDNFKKVNDTLGHNWSDEMLLQVSNRLREVIRKGDYVARIGGDEFVIILELLDSSNDASKIAKRLIGLFGSPIILSGKAVPCTISMGIALYPVGGQTPSELLQHADMAMYKAKHKGKNTYQFFTQQLNDDLQRCYQIEQCLPNAIHHDELDIAYQPIMDIQQNKMIGVEALMRWVNPDLGKIPPAEFIPIAEESGMIHELGQWLVKRTCQQVAKWKEAHPDLLADFNLSLNFSVLQFSKGDMAETIFHYINQCNLNPHNLIIELTETAIRQNTPYVAQSLSQLKKAGIKLAIDDFGTGYSSLVSINQLPISHLKIYHTLLKNIGSDKNNAAMVKTIIKLGETMGIEIIASGVENVEQVNFLNTHQCRFAQGFYYHKALTTQEIGEILCSTHGVSSANGH